MRLVITSILCAVMMLLQGGLAWSADVSAKPVRLAVLPLDVARTGSYSYLGNSIGQMLTTRFSSLEKIEVVGRNLSGAALENLRTELKAGDFRSVALKLQADWVADGSVYSLKNGIKMNLTLYPGEEGVEPALFGITAEKPEDILPAITRLTADIGNILTDSGEKPEDAAASKKDDGLAAFRTPHPELAYKKGIFAAGGLTGDESERFSASGVRRSSSIPISVESMVLADLDGDSKNELAVASRGEIRLFHFEDSRFHQVASYTFKRDKKIHALTVWSGDKGSGARLLVSADDDKMPASAVLSWNGSDTLQLTQDNIGWYIRAVNMPGEGDIIAGQRLEADTKSWQLAPEVFRLLFDERTVRLIHGDRLVLPEQTRLFDFVYVDLNGDNIVETIVIDGRNKLLVYNSNMELLWVSSASYGGGLSFFGQPLSDDERNDEAPSRLLNYLPGRLEVKDIDLNGTPEIIVNTNTVGTIVRFFPHLKSFDGGSVACLGWSDGVLKELWRTNRINGYVADYAFETAGETGTASENGAGHLYVALAEEKSILDKFIPGLASETTRIFAYEILISSPKDK